MSRVYARIQDVYGTHTVVEIVREINNIEEEWSPDFLQTLIEITDMEPQPEVGWIYDNGDLSPPPPYVPTPLGERSLAISNGCDVRSTAKPALNAKYFADGPVWQKMTNEVLYIVSFNKFSGGLTQVEMPTKDGTVLITDKNDFKNIVQAIGDWLTLWDSYVAGNAESPPDFMTIA